MKNKKQIIIIAISLIAVAILVLAYFLVKSNITKTNLKKTQDKMISSMKDKPFEGSYIVSSSNLKGTFDATGNFQGDILKNDKVVQNLIKFNNNIYTKEPNTDKWFKEENPTYLSELNLMLNFKNIKLEKKLANDSDGNLVYEISYSPLTDKTNKAKIATGIATLDKSSFQLKKLIFNSNQTKNSNNSDFNNTIINFKLISDPPAISEPQI